MIDVIIVIDDDNDHIILVFRQIFNSNEVCMKPILYCMYTYLTEWVIVHRAH